ncbi:MAG: CHASE2 domain-containing protein [Bacillota bacterium]
MKKKTIFKIYITASIFFTLAYAVIPIIPYTARFTWFENLEVVSLNFRMKMRGPVKPSGKVVIIGIDDRSISALAIRERDPWPWRRSVYARLIRKLGDAGAKSIIMDLSFDYMDPDDLEGDRQFAEILFEYPIVTIGSYVVESAEKYMLMDGKYREKLEQNQDYLRFRYQFLNPDPDPYYLSSFYSVYKMVPPDTLFMNSARGYSIYEIGSADEDGMYHIIPLVFHEQYLNKQGKASLIFLPTLDILGLCAYYGIEPSEILLDLKRHRIILGDKCTIPVDEKGYFTLNYYTESFPEKSAVDILESGDPALLKKYFRDKIVLIGYTSGAKGLFDVRPTPFNKNEAGIQLHATLLQNVLDRNYLIRLPYAANLGIILLCLIFFSCILHFSGLRTGIALALSFIAAFNIIAYILYLKNIWADVFYPDILFFVFFLFNTIIRVYRENKEKIQIKSFFTKFVPAPVVEEILKDPKRIHLGGERMNITVLFSDIVGFTSISEQLEPEEMVRLLNEYLTEMTAIIKDRFNGTLDKFIGDAIVAIFGAPFSAPDDPVRAVNAALAMRDKVRQLQEKWQTRGEKYIFRIGIGINTGYAVVGNIGSPDRMNYTCIGDTVNTASRLESATRTTDAEILISDSTYQAVKDYFKCIELAPIIVKGKKDALRIYSVISRKGRYVK